MRVASFRLGVLLMLVSTVAWGAAGDPDPTFGTNGVVTTSISAYSEAYAVVQQADGKIVAGGQVADEVTFSARTDALLVRYGPDGTLDATFGTGGIVRTDVVPAGPGSRFEEVLQQPGGRLVGVGTVSAYSTTGGDIALVRYEADGSVDPSFGSGGIVVTDVAGRADRAVAAAIQTDGRIVVAGSTRAGVSDSDFLVLRYDSDGAPDPTFGTGGVVQLDLAGQYEQAFDVLLVPGGRIVLVGSSGTAPGIGVAAGRRCAGRARCLRRTRPHVRHRRGGASHALPAFRHSLYAVRLAGGQIMALGSGSNDGIAGFQFFARFTAAGALDTTFGGGDGIATPAVGPVGFDLERAADGGVLNIGYGFVWGFFYGALGASRYDADGEPDSTWGNAGRAVIHVPGRYNQGALAGFEDSATGALVVAGFAATGPPDGFSEPRQLALARFLGVRPPCTTDADCDTCERCGVTGVCENGPRTACERPGPAPGAKLVYRGYARPGAHPLEVASHRRRGRLRRHGGRGRALHVVGDHAALREPRPGRRRLADGCAGDDIPRRPPHEPGNATHPCRAAVGRESGGRQRRRQPERLGRSAARAGGPEHPPGGPAARNERQVLRGHVSPFGVHHAIPGAHPQRIRLLSRRNPESAETAADDICRARDRLPAAERVALARGTGLVARGRIAMSSFRQRISVLGPGRR